MKQIDYKDFGMRVRRQRRLRHLTQQEFAALCGISTSFLGHIERGHRIASMETLCTICNILKIQPGYFLASGLNDGLVLRPIEEINDELLLRLAQDTREENDPIVHWTDDQPVT